MAKPLTAVITAAVLAAAFALLSAPSARLAASPVAAPAAAAMRACAERPWPYLNCVGTRFGNPHIRLVTADRLAP